jgi:hypothetical protein
MYALKTPTLGIFWRTDSYVKAKIAQVQLTLKFKDYTIEVVKL